MRVAENGQLALLVEHARVVADDPVPIARVMVQSQQQFPILEFGKAGVDVLDEDQLDAGKVGRRLLDDRAG